LNHRDHREHREVRGKMVHASPCPLWMAKRRGAGRGFSLFEILLALAIFSVAFFAIVEGVTVQIRAEKLAEDHTRAAMLAQNVIEEIRYGGVLEETSESGEFEDENVGFDWSYTLEETELEGLYRLRMGVNWSDGLSRKSYETETMLSER